MSFGERLKEARTAKGYTQEQLAALIGVAKSTLTGYEKNNREPDVPKIKALSEHLEVDPHFLLEIENVFPKHLASGFINKYNALDEHGKDTVNAVLDKEYERICKNNKVATYLIKPNFSTTDSTDEEIEAEDFEDMRLYNQPSSAGLGSMIDSDDYELIQIPTSKIPRGAEFCVKIIGNSMEPTINDGDIVFIKPTPQLENNEIGIFFQDGEMFCKRLYIDYNRKRAYLVSDNPEYKPLKISEDCLTIGKVLLLK